MEKGELENLVEQTIDVMLEIGKVEEALASVTRRIEELSRTVDSHWRPDFYARTTPEERQ